MKNQTARDISINYAIELMNHEYDYVAFFGYPPSPDCYDFWNNATISKIESLIILWDNIDRILNREKYAC